MSGQPAHVAHGWLLWVFAGVLAVVAVVLLLPAGPATQAEPPVRITQLETETAGPPPSPSPSLSVSRSAEPPDSAAPEPSGPADDPAWRLVVDGFVVDFTTRGSGQQDWLARVSRWTTQEMSAQLSGTDPARIPSVALTHWDPLSVGSYAVEWKATYDSGLVLYGRVELGTTGWQVTSVLPARQN